MVRLFWLILNDLSHLSFCVPSNVLKARAAVVLYEPNVSA